MKMKQRFRQTFALLKRNLKTLALYELLYALFTSLVTVPFAMTGFKAIMNLTGYKYLTIENVGKFVLNPIALVLLILLLIIIAAVETWHLTTIITILDRSRQDKTVSLMAAVRYSVKQLGWVFQRGDCLLVFFVLFLLPFTGFGTGVISQMDVPEFIMDTINKNGLYSAAFTVLNLGIVYLVLRWMYAVHNMTLEHTGFLKAAKHSAKLMKRHKLRNLLTMLLLELTLYAALGLLLLIAAPIVYLLLKMKAIASDVLTSIILVASGFGLMLFTMFSPIRFAMVSTLFYHDRETAGDPDLHADCPEPEIPTARRKRITVICCVLAAVIAITGCTVMLRLARSGVWNLNVENVRTMEVSAHRGASAYYPENTMAAFRGAYEQNADWAELDVQQSSDGQIFVMHDTNFVRTTGVNKNCWELTYEEISQLDAGSFFSAEFAGEKIPLLSEVLAYAKEVGIRLNIELKPTGHETDFEKQVVDLIREAGLADRCVVTSQVYNVLENIKAYDPDIVTVYVMSVAVGDIESLTAADHFSIEASFVTEDLVSRMHNLGKQVYAWTVDTEDSISAMIETSCDNIITNNTPLAKEIIKTGSSSFLRELMSIYRTALE